MSGNVERYTAAGGVVVRDQQVLVLHWTTRGEVRLPKGHVEPGETVREAALRETREETGYLDVRIVADIGHQRVSFEHRGRQVVRSERYFLMDLPAGRRLARGTSEPKFDPVWLSWDRAIESLTFEAERNWVQRARSLAEELGIAA